MELPNLNYLNELSGNNEVFNQKIIAILKEELPEEIKNYYSLLEAQDFKATSELVHKLKHKISILGLEKSYYIAEQYEYGLKQGSTELHPEFEAILNCMQNFVDDL